MNSTSARNCISTVTVPSPWQVSQRPPGILNKSGRGVAAALGLAGGGEQAANDVEGLDVGHRVGAGCAADGRLIDHHRGTDALGAVHAFAAGAPSTVGRGTVRRFRGIIEPKIVLGFAGLVQGFSERKITSYSVDFPEPDTPVTTTSILRGISTSIFFRLWARAPAIRSKGALQYDIASLLYEARRSAAGAAAGAAGPLSRLLARLCAG